MAENNFYEWLELPVERFESDPAVLSPILEKFITDWNSSKDLKKQNRAAIYQTAMRAAIQDADQWEKIYIEFKKSVDEKILDALMMCAVNQSITPDQANAIATTYKVSAQYIENIVKSNGYSFVGPIPPTPISKYCLKDMEPDSKAKGQLDSIQKSITELGFHTLAELIDHELNTETNLSTVSKDSVLEALKDIKKRWSKVSASSEKHQQKSHFDRICSGMTAFLKNYEISDYIQYLNWKKVSDILNGVRSKLTNLSLDALNDKTYNSTIDSIFSVIGDREKAQSILDNYCVEKNIGYPKPLPNVAVCPYCSNSFEKKTPLQNNCPSCNRSFIVNCPKCGKQKNFLLESHCDGIDLLQYPYLERQLQDTQRMLDSLDYSAVRIRVREITQKWANFPGTSEILGKCQSIEQSYGSDLKKLRELCDAHKYYEAKIICDRLSGTYPGFKITHQGIYDAINKADSLYQTAKSEKNDDKQSEILHEVLSLVSDHPEANADIKVKGGIKPVQGLKGVVSADAATIVLSWTSQNRPNSVNYTVRRKINTPVSNHADGEELCITQSTSFSDSDLREGEAYYYAVFASLGPLQTPICITQEALIYLRKPEITVNPKDSGVSVTWQHTSIDIKAYISDSQIKAYGEGNACKGITPAGFDIEGLTNGRKYCVSVFKTITHLGKEYHSEGAIHTFTPMVSIKPPEITKSIGHGDGEYILTHVNPSADVTLEIYYSQMQAQIPSNFSMNLSDLKKSLRKANVIDLGNNQYAINMNGATEMYVYPVVCRGEVATVGNYLCLRYAKSIQIYRSVVSGNKLCLYIDNWVDGADTLFICYNDDAYPQDKDDTDRRISITKNEYDRKRLLEIQSIQNQEYYISIFARKKGEYIPVCNYYFDNSIRESATVNYTFQVGPFGGLSIVFESEVSKLPEIDICVNSGCVPLTKQGGTVIYTIPAGSNGNATIKIPNYRVRGNTYAKLFTDRAGFVLLMKSGTGKIK